ncbi:MAG: ABC transporter ATP-binding protein [Alphaproteobacteria bacterium]|nr:ABC transporter ATP-binding protein [Alphaproteobacteria bacterium]
MSYILRQWRRRPALFAGLAGFTAIATVLDVFTPVAAGLMIDALSNSDQSSETHWAAYAIFMAVAVGFHALRQLAVRCEIPFSSANMADLVSDVFAKVQRFSLDWHANTFGGSVVRKITRGMWAYDTITATTWFSLIPTVAVLYGQGIYMMTVWPWVGAFALAIATISLAAAIGLSRYYIHPQNMRSNAVDSKLGGAIADTVTGIATVKSFGAEAEEDQRFTGLAWRWRAEAMKTWFRFVDTWLIQTVIVLAMQAGLVGALVWLWQRGEASPGDVVYAVTAVLLMSGYMRRFGEEVQNVQRALDEIQDLALFDKQVAEVTDRPNAPDFEPGSGEVRFDAVGFTYAGQTQPLYTDFDLRIEPGEKVALVGPTGSGKSTFVKLVQRLYDVNEGHVRIDGQDVRDVTQASLRRHIALVPQDPALFHRSIAENIAYGSPHATPEAVVAAARAAHAHDFIMRLPKGYRTLVGERGVKLSGGERQRVAIARAILADAPILILDEATSSLDNETERDIQEAMNTVMRDRTTIIIAHRLSTIRDADRILVFEAGRIVEQGTHAELTAKDEGVYARLAALAAG